MMLPFGLFRLSTFKAVTFVVVVVGFSFPVSARAEVRTVEVADLAARSELIVIAKVSKIEGAPANLERDDAGMPPLKVATAQVLETWKGKPVPEVRYIASPDSMCDTSHAEKGERVLLFLTYAHWRKDRSFLSISHAGRGRMPLSEVKGKWYAALQDEIILPQGTPTISEQKTVRITLPGSEQNQPATVVSYSATSIDMGRLRGLVKLTTLGK